MGGRRVLSKGSMGEGSRAGIAARPFPQPPMGARGGSSERPGTPVVSPRPARWAEVLVRVIPPIRTSGELPVVSPSR